MGKLNGKRRPILEELRDFMRDKEGSGIAYGARKRVAEHCRVAFITVNRWLSGALPISQSREGEIRAMIAAKIDLTPRSCAPLTRPKRGNYRPERKISAKRN